MRGTLRMTLCGTSERASASPAGADRQRWLAPALLGLSLLVAACGSDPASSVPGATGAGASAPVAPNGAGASAPVAGTSAAAGSGAAGVAAVGGAGSGVGTAGRGPAGAAAGSSAGSSGVGATAGASSGSSGGAAGSLGGEAGAAGAAEPMGPASGPFPPVTDFAATGPFQGTTLDASGPNNNYTVYLPTELAKDGVKHPIVAWMSGGGTTPQGYTLLPHLATHGFVVIAANTIPGIGAEVMLGQELIAGIDWAIAENERQGSMLFGKLDTTKIASMGYSMGSLATFTIADDKRLTTTVHISGGNMVADRVNKLHAPAAFICGTPGDASCNILSAECDIAAANCDIDFMNAKTPVFYANFMGGHLGILTEPNMTRVRKITTAWLRWKLMSDTTLTAMFVGADCKACKDPDFAKVQQKNDLK